MTCGIYLLKFKTTTKVYVGQSIDVEGRYSAHKTKLRCNNHSAKLLEAYRQYGMPDLDIILECTKEELDASENEAIKIFDSVANGFNACKTAGGGNNLWGESVGNSKYSNIQIEESFLLLVNSPELSSKEISSITGVSKATIDAISGLKVHKWLWDKYPENYLILVNRPISEKLGKNKMLKDLNKNYPKLKSPEGILYTVDNASQFAKIHNLNNAHIIQVLKGKEKQHKGWTAYYEH